LVVGVLDDRYGFHFFDGCGGIVASERHLAQPSKVFTPAAGTFACRRRFFPHDTFAATGPRISVGSTATPAGVITPTLLEDSSVYQRFPSGPSAIPTGPLLEGNAYSVIAPVLGDSLEILLVPRSANHRFPSGPSVMPYGSLPAGIV